MRATNLIITIIICVTLLIIGFFFWPTPYRYDLVKSGVNTYPLRIHRLTGDVEIFLYRPGKWIPLKRKEPKIKKIPEKELSKITGVVLLENGYLKGKLYNGTNWTVTKIVLAVKAKGDIWDEVLQKMKRKEREASLDKERLKRFGFSDKEIEDYLNKKEKIQVCVDKYLDDADFLSKQAVEKVIFFLRSLHGLTRAKYYPQACLKQTGLFLKNNKPKPFDGIIREICHPWIASLLPL